MAFERFQKLGDERFTKIVNDLSLGKPAMTLAREIQGEWGEFKDVAEKTLTQHLNRLRQAVAKGVYGTKVAKEIEKGHQPQIALMKNVSPSVLERMEKLAQWQDKRCQDMLEKEQKIPIPTPNVTNAVNAIFTDYSNHLKDIQELRWKMGLDPFTPISGSIVKGASVTTRHPDGTETHQAVFQAVEAVEQIFQRRGVKVINQP